MKLRPSYEGVEINFLPYFEGLSLGPSGSANSPTLGIHRTEPDCSAILSLGKAGQHLYIYAVHLYFQQWCEGGWESGSDAFEEE